MTDPFLDSLTSEKAEHIIESLREGIPPMDFTLPFTVGRKSELAELKGTLTGNTVAGSGRFVKANYGSGKSHLLKVIREMALDAEYAVSYITMDAKGGVRGNRMDQVFEAVCRGIEVPPGGSRGLVNLFRVAADSEIDVDRVVRSGYWIRATRANCDDKADRFQRGVYFKYRSDRPYFYQQCWNALTDLDKLAKTCGFKGLVLLVDEFEDVVTNLNRYDYQATALENLLAFFDGEKFAGLSYFAVTPEFTRQWRWLPAGAKLDKKPSFALTPPEKADIKRLARTIRAVHAIAYDLEPDETLSDEDLEREVEKLLGISSQDRIRQTIEGIVEALDDAAE
jgi:hypothetical protein